MSSGRFIRWTQTLAGSGSITDTVVNGFEYVIRCHSVRRYVQVFAARTYRAMSSIPRQANFGKQVGSPAEFAAMQPVLQRVQHSTKSQIAVKSISRRTISAAA